MIVLDASVMIAVLDRTDAHFPEARELFENHADERLLAHRVTITEVLVRPMRVGRGAEAVDALRDLGIESIDELDEPAALASLRARSGLKLPDCCVLLAGRRLGAAVATFDDRLRQAVLENGLIALPNEVGAGAPGRMR
ncbi:type II toxin-antitoxin system VapC family toxin [Microbacterium gorillae]|uniref:type II toxin-antitoxin system VapC family toxin n=1 Tax=Microbacterium gorillae TaxID=1231063 RepID=UPI003D99740E